MDYFFTTRDYSRISGRDFDNRILEIPLFEATVSDRFRAYSIGKKINDNPRMNLVQIKSENPYFDITYNPNPGGLLQGNKIYRIMFSGTAGVLGTTGDNILFNTYVDEIANLYLEYFNKTVHKGDMQRDPVKVNNREPGNPEPGNPEPGNREPGNREPGNREPGNREPGSGGYLKRRNRRTKSRCTKSRRTKSRRTKSRRTHCS